jgi:hypothetical protein
MSCAAASTSADNDDVEEFVHQDTGHGIDAFKKRTRYVFGDVTASKDSAMARTASVINDEWKILVKSVCDTR